MCHVIVHRDDVPGGTGVQTAPIGELEEDNISCTITFHASQTLRTIVLCYRDFRSWPLKGTQLMDNRKVTNSFFV
jgi:Ca2+-transporting ATPase